MVKSWWLFLVGVMLLSGFVDGNVAGAGGR